MNRIWIDFKQPVSPKLRLLRVSLLVFGALALAYGLIQQQQVKKEQTSLLWQRQSLAQTKPHRLPAMRIATELDSSHDAIKRVNEILRQLNQPWSQLFNALEQAMGSKVSILSVAPDPHKSTIILKAQAANMDAAIDFVKRLQATKLLTGVYLVNQEVVTEHEQQHLEFTVSAGLGVSK
ncbi:MAG: PilN domain-containing protein [Methylovulum sp.]|nr:PilN domain-containing protein [Methylovulum sp.]